MALKLQDFIDIDQFQMLQDRLNEIYSFPSAIIDNEGKVLTATAWQDVCTKFHRQNSECEKECIKSDQYIADHLHEANPAVSYQCPHGLIDNATPIIIEGVHYGNFFTGQFFLKPPDLNFFRTQAKRYGFEAEAYIEAVRKVPIWTKEQLDSYLFFIKGLIEVISAIGLKNLKEIETRKRMQESEEQFRAILQTAMDGFWLVDMQGRLLEVNETYCRMSGYSKQELLAMRISDIEATETWDAIFTHIQKVMTQGEDRFESRHRRKDGSIYDVEVSVQYRPADGGQIVTFLRDITKRKRSENELDLSKRRLELTLQSAGAGTWDWDMTSQRLNWSRELYVLFGLNPDGSEATFDTWSQVLHPNDRENANHRIENAINQRIALSNEYRIILPDGEVRWINALGKTVYDESGKPLQMGGICTDITERKKIEDSLRESELRLRLSIDNMLEAYALHEAIFDENGRMVDYRFLEFNPAAQKVTNIVREEIVGRTALELYPHIVERGLLDRYADVMATGVPDVIEDFYYAGDNLDKALDISCFRIDARHFVCVFHDITDRKRAEEQLQSTKVQLIDALEIAHLGHWEYDVANDLFTFNDQFYKIFRTTAEQCGGYTMHSAEYAHRFVHPDEMYMVGEETRKAIETTEPHFNRQIEHRMLYADGTVGYISVRFFIVKDSHGRTVKTYGVNQDITERKRAEENLREREEWFAKIFNTASNAIAITSWPGGYITNVNATWVVETGLELNVVIGKTAIELGLWKNLAARKQCVDMLKEQGHVRNFETAMIFRSKEVPFSLTAILMEMRGQQYVLWELRNVSQIKNAEMEQDKLRQQLNRSEKMEALGQLAGGVAHDLNNVLGVTMAYAEMLQEQGVNSQQQKKFAENIFSSTQKAATIIQDMLTLARRGVAVSKVIDLNNIVSLVFNSPELDKVRDFHPSVTFKKELPDTLLNILGSPVHLEKTVFNLLSNAAEAISGNGEVTIQTENRYLDTPVQGYDTVQEGEYVVITVSDTGQGIAAGELKKIFEPFYTKKTMGRSGTGLGLAIVWGTVKDHDGYIDVQSAEGRGTTFNLYFPVTREQVSEEDIGISVDQFRGKGEKILVIDDAEGQRDVACTLLNGLGYEVHSVGSGEEAVEYLQENSADILVLDMIMVPGIDGLETYRRVRKIRPGQKAIIVSGFSETDRVKEAQKLGAGAYVRKPYLKETIGVAVRDELARK